MTYTIKRWWMENTTSRNAFYQVAEITCDDLGSPTVAVLNYGSLDKVDRSARGKGGIWHLPRQAGTLTIKAGRDAAVSAVMAKSRGDYRIVRENSFDVPDEKVRSTISELVGPRRLEEVMGHFDAVDQDIAMRSARARAPAPPPETQEETDKRITEVNPMWGTW